MNIRGGGGGRPTLVSPSLSSVTEVMLAHIHNQMRTARDLGVGSLYTVQVMLAASVGDVDHLARLIDLDPGLVHAREPGLLQQVGGVGCMTEKSAHIS